MTTERVCRNGVCRVRTITGPAKPRKRRRRSSFITDKRHFAGVKAHDTRLFRQFLECWERCAWNNEALSTQPDPGIRFSLYRKNFGDLLALRDWVFKYCGWEK